MNETKHTPGPWHIGKDPAHIYAGYTKHVATVHGGDCLPPDVSDANARLIAAAPDLLQSAKAFVTYATRESQPYEMTIAEQTAFIAMKNAIEKAEGK